MDKSWYIYSSYIFSDPWGEKNHHSSQSSRRKPESPSPPPALPAKKSGGRRSRGQEPEKSQPNPPKLPEKPPKLPEKRQRPAPAPVHPPEHLRNNQDYETESEEEDSEDFEVNDFSKPLSVRRAVIYHISSYWFRRNYSFLNLKIVKNSSNCRKFQFFTE